MINDTHGTFIADAVPRATVGYAQIEKYGLQKSSHGVQGVTCVDATYLPSLYYGLCSDIAYQCKVLRIRYLSTRCSIHFKPKQYFEQES